jgi:hypothetical protein
MQLVIGNQRENRQPNCRGNKKSYDLAAMACGATRRALT